ncbi:hypothetical protein SLEP1_g53719 [Rubroshorea leprosula]|uniref:Uncharacterized protein n=1 Tax=Rubroshorea leprosula TaxID=152421 RepID=A0AAV5MA48_9ROSI|nr:hypothetical protein SLEP1_g53719 [Rubroshorea leprosula]
MLGMVACKSFYFTTIQLLCESVKQHEYQPIHNCFTVLAFKLEKKLGFHDQPSNTEFISTALPRLVAINWHRKMVDRGWEIVIQMLVRWPIPLSMDNGYFSGETFKNVAYLKLDTNASHSLNHSYLSQEFLWWVEGKPNDMFLPSWSCTMVLNPILLQAAKGEPFDGHHDTSSLFILEDKDALKGRELINEIAQVVEAQQEETNVEERDKLADEPTNESARMVQNQPPALEITHAMEEQSTLLSQGDQLVEIKETFKELNSSTHKLFGEMPELFGLETTPISGSVIVIFPKFGCVGDDFGELWVKVHESSNASLVTLGQKGMADAYEEPLALLFPKPDMEMESDNGDAVIILDAELNGKKEMDLVLLLKVERLCCDLKEFHWTKIIGATIWYFKTLRMESFPRHEHMLRRSIILLAVLLSNSLWHVMDNLHRKLVDRGRGAVLMVVINI